MRLTLFYVTHFEQYGNGKSSLILRARFLVADVASQRESLHNYVT